MGGWESETSTWKTEKLKSQPGMAAQALISSTRETGISGSFEFHYSQDSIIETMPLGKKRKKTIKK